MDEFVDRVIGNYEIHERIGKGGFGAVYRGYQKFVNREVAVKIILPIYANEPEFIRRFEAEAQLVARLEHPYIVPLYDYWRDPNGAYLVMRLLRGGSLADLIDKGPMPLDMAKRLLDQMAAALTFAHRNNVIHQDLKPANILMDEEGSAYLSDFGIAKEINKEKLGEQDDAPRQGTLLYSAPEVLNYNPVSFRSDVYSLGIMLFEMLTGEVPFKASRVDDIIARHSLDPLPSVRTVRPELTEDFDRVLEQATAKNPRARYPDALALALDFRRAMETMQQAKAEAPVRREREPTQPILPIDPPNPYKGLRPFREADAQDFHGRDAFIARLIRRLGEPGSASCFLAVVGGSGSGKSSVVRAGLIPRLRAGALHGSDKWFYVEMTPGAHPLAELERALLKVAANPRLRLKERLAEEDGFGLYRALDDLLPDPNAQLVVVIDQFEEVFTIAQDPAERDVFLKSIAKTVTEALSRLWVIVTLRADFMDRPLEHAEFGAVLSERHELILPMTEGELEQSISRPAERVGLALEASLVAVMLKDISRQPGALPLLQYALTELYANRERKTNALTLDVYQRMGGISGALTRRADEVYGQQLTTAEQKHAARQLFLRLIAVNEDAEPTRRRVLQEDVVPGEEEKKKVMGVMNAFARARLLTLDVDPLTRKPTVEIAHEALIREWGHARQWIAESRELLETQRRLSSATNEWVKSGRDESYLAGGSRLDGFEEKIGKRELLPNEQESAYVASSQQKRAAAERLRQRVMAALVSLTTIAVIASVIALALRGIAESNAALAATNAYVAQLNAAQSRSRELAVTALIYRDQPDLALLISLEALRAYDTFDARNSLLTNLQLRPQLTRFFYGHQGGVRAVAFSPDGTRIASASLDRTAVLWDAATGARLFTLEGHRARVNALAFSPDGALLATGGGDNTVLLWDTATGELLAALEGHTDGVRGAVFTPDGALLITVGDDRRVLLWDVAARALARDLRLHEGGVLSVAVSPLADRLVFATGGGDRNVILWAFAPGADVRTADARATTLTGAQNLVLSTAFNADGTLLAAGSQDGTARLWRIVTDGDTLTPAALTPLPGHVAGVRAVAFAPGRPQVATADGGGTIRLWDVSFSFAVTDTFANVQNAPLQALAYAPDGALLASGGDASGVLLWDTRQRQPFARVLSGQSQGIQSIAARGDWLAAAAGDAGAGASRQSADSSLWLWHLTTGEHLTLLEGEAALLTSVVFTPDAVITGALDGVLRVFDPTTGAQTTAVDSAHPIISMALSADGRMLALGSPSGEVFLRRADDPALPAFGAPAAAHSDQLAALAFSPDGATLATAGYDALVRLWSIGADGALTLRHTLSGHTDDVLGLAFSANGALLASAGRDRLIFLWNAATGERIGQPLDGHTERVTGVAFSPDGTLLASAGYDNVLMLWDTAQQRRLGVPFDGHRDWVNALLWTPDGALVSGSNDRTLRLWDAALPSWQARACRIANRDLTPDEWQQYLQVDAYHGTCSD